MSCSGKSSLAVLALAALVVALARPALAQPAAPGAADAPWTTAFPDVATNVRAGRPLVLLVVVPLCSNDQINCGATWAGQPGRLETNLYWGAIFGARRFLERPRGGWETVDTSIPSDAILEQAVFRRRVSGAAWQSPHDVELLVVLHAVHGAEIDHAVDRFWSAATSGGKVQFHDRGRVREEPITVAGYAGHNRLMDGKTLPAAGAGHTAIPSFVLACMSESYFGAKLRASGSGTVLMTRALMAPEGYVLDAVASAMGENRSARAIRASAVEATMRWQRIPRNQAEWVFAPVRP